MTDRLLRAFAIVVVVALALPPFIEVAAMSNPNQRFTAGALIVLAVIGGVYAGAIRRPLVARFTTLVYGVFGLGFPLFVSLRPVPFLLAYLVALLEMNVLLYQVAAYGPVLAAFHAEDGIARRVRLVALRSLGVSSLALALAFGGSVALLPLFTLETGSTDPLTALALAGSLVLIVTMLVVLPESPFVRKERPSKLR